MRVLFLIVDALPPRHVDDATTPTLAALAREGASAVGRAVMTSATYPNHATLVTGVRPEIHGLTGNFVFRGGAIVTAESQGPGVPTLFDGAAEAGIACAAVFGDQHLVAVTAADRAGTHWPSEGIIPDGAVPTSDGYIADVSTVEALCDVLAGDADLVVAQLNDPDTAGHEFGPDASDAAEVYRRTDAWLAVVLSALQSRWNETFLAVVSDHDQVTVTEHECVDLWSPMRALGLDLTILPEGDAAVVIGEDPSAGRWLDDISGVDAHQPWYDDSRLAWTTPGKVFGWGECQLHGIHGGPRTQTTVAVVSGGHPAVRVAAESLAVRRPHAEDWAPTLAAVLGLDLPASTGRSLLGG